MSRGSRGAEAPPLHHIRPRGGRECVYGTFTASSPEASGALQFVLSSWVAAATPESGAAATVLADGTHQLSVCDPGPSATIPPRTGPAADLVARQLSRLGG